MATSNQYVSVRHMCAPEPCYGENDGSMRRIVSASAIVGSAGSSVGAVLDDPDRRQHGLSKRPSKHARGVEPELIRILANAPLYCVRRHEQGRNFPRISQRRADLVLDLTNDSLGIDREPAAPLVEENIGVLKVSMKQACVRL